MRTIFLFSFWMVSYVYVLYPALMWLLSLFYAPLRKGDGHCPSISIILSAYNEERHMERKITSLLALAYPADRMEILIGSDGSVDGTDTIVLKYRDSGVRLFRQEERRGKPAMLNILVREAKGEILVFMDARQELEHNAVAALVSSFADPGVGAVSGQLFFREETTAGKAGSGMGLYWKYEKFIRLCESRTGSMLGATGSFYAVRRELCPVLPEDIVLDDVYIPLTIALKGSRALFNEEARI